MARPRFKRSAAGFREILNSDEVAAELERRCQPAADAARASAPRDTGDYADGIEVEVVTTDRKVGRVVARDGKSLIVEARTRNLGRALDAMGGG